MPNFRRFLSRRRLLACVSAAALVFGLLMLHPYPRQSLFGPTIRGKPWCVWEGEVRHFVHKEEFENAPTAKILGWLGIGHDDLERDELFNDAEMFPLVLQLLDDSDPEIRFTATLAIWQYELLRGAAALPALYRRLREDGGKNRLLAAATIWKMNKDKACVQVILLALADSANRETQTFAASALLHSNICGEMPEIFPQIVKCTRDEKNYLLCVHATKMLEQFGVKAAPILQEALLDGNIRFRLYAAEGLTRLRINSEGVVAVLNEVLSDPNGYDPDRIEAAEIAKKLGRDAKELIPALEKLRQSRHQYVREPVIDALLAIDPQRFEHLKTERKIE